MPLVSLDKPIRSCKRSDCGIVLVLVTNRDLKRKRFCSPSCRQKWRFANGQAIRGGIRPKGNFPPKAPRICAVCQSPFAPNSRSHKWCYTCAPSPRARGRLKLYGVSQPQFDALVAAQGGKCPICLERPPTDLDHDHLTGTPRGVLCSPCNSSLGIFRESTAILRRAIAYLEVPLAICE